MGSRSSSVCTGNIAILDMWVCLKMGYIPKVCVLIRRTLSSQRVSGYLCSDEQISQVFTSIIHTDAFVECSFQWHKSFRDVSKKLWENGPLRRLLSGISYWIMAPGSFTVSKFRHVFLWIWRKVPVDFEILTHYAGCGLSLLRFLGVRSCRATQAVLLSRKVFWL